MKEKMDIAALRVDQSPMRSGFCSATYTPWGIQVLESRYCRMILGATSLGECQDIRRWLKADQHLHRVIKANLFLNLRKVVRRLIAQGKPGKRNHQ